MRQREKVRINIQRENEALDVDHVSRWPKAAKYETQELCLYPHESVQAILKALDAVELRPELKIDNLSIGVRVLFNDEIRVRLGEIFEVINRRGFRLSVYLSVRECDFKYYHKRDIHKSFWVDVEKVEKERLQEALSVLKSVRHLLFGHRSFQKRIDRLSAGHLRCIECLPQFENLDTLFLKTESEALSDAEADAVFRYPFADKIAGVALAWDIADDIAPRIHDIEIYPYDNEVVAAMETLPALEKIEVLLPAEWEDVDMEAKSRFEAYLASPKCTVTSLFFQCTLCPYEALGTDNSEQCNVAMDVIPKVPLLRTLEFNNFANVCIDQLIEQIRKAPSIDSVNLTIDFEYDYEIVTKVFKLQMEFRPKRLFAHIAYTPTEDVHQVWMQTNKVSFVSLVYETLENFERIPDPLSFQLSSWPRLLDKLGYVFGREQKNYKPNDDISNAQLKSVRLDAIYGVLLLLLGAPERILERRESDERAGLVKKPDIIELLSDDDDDVDVIVVIDDDSGDEDVPTKKRKVT